MGFGLGSFYFPYIVVDVPSGNKILAAHSTRSFGSKLKTLAMRSAFLNDAADKI